MSARSFSTMTALGLMSGTSRDGIDAAVVRTDGVSVFERGPSSTTPYEEAFRNRLAAAAGGEGKLSDMECELTMRHVAVVHDLLEKNSITFSEIDVIGFHGHTILHAPEAGRTRRIGDGRLLARATGVPVVDDFRAADVAAGGQGAPLAPVYHWALARALPKPLAVLNLGGVANVTWIGEAPAASRTSGATGPAAAEILAFDTGPGNALLDDWVGSRTGAPFDRDGALASRGRVATPALEALMSHPYFSLPPPKSLDRDAFSLAAVGALSPEDGAATLTAFTAEAVRAALGRLPEAPPRWLAAGGGRRNRALMNELAARTGAPVEPVEAVGWDGAALEAEAFAYLAVRTVRGLPSSWPGTTGVPHPCVGGVVHRPA